MHLSLLLRLTGPSKSSRKESLYFVDEGVSGKRGSLPAWNELGSVTQGDGVIRDVSSMSPSGDFDTGTDMDRCTRVCAPLSENRHYGPSASEPEFMAG